MNSGLYEITDDSGLLALIDPYRFRSFLNANWTLDQIVLRFREEMKNRRMLIWGTGREGMWRIEVRFRVSAVTGFREFTAPLSASEGHLLFTDYESLTMAAQFADIKLPEANQIDLLVPVRPGHYLCRVVQRFHPESNPRLRDGDADFFIELTSTKSIASDEGGLPRIPWSDL